MAKFCDSNLKMSDIGNFFKATNYEEIDQEGNEDLALVRFEFFEVLIRIARAKYLDTNQCQNIMVALERLIRTHLLGI